VSAAEPENRALRKFWRKEAARKLKITLEVLRGVIVEFRDSGTLIVQE
jgi:hypothetical protein